MKRSVTWAMLRGHAWSYSGLAVVLVASSTLVGSSLVLRAAARAQDVDLSGLSRNDGAKHLLLLQSGRDASTFMAVLGGLVAVFLVAQSVGFVIDGRRRELALLRLAGASGRQVTAMILRESVTLGLVCSVLGSCLSLAVVRPYAALLAEQNNWLAGFPVRLHVSALVWCVVVMTGVTVLGSCTAARRIVRIPPVEAVQTLEQHPRAMSPGRWVLGGLGAAAAASFLAVPPASIDYKITAAGVGGGAVLLVSAIAPLIVPAMARSLGGLLTLVAPASGLIAREHTVHDARRTAALATPVMIILGLGAVFGMIAQTGRAESSLGLEALRNTHVVVDIPAERSDSDAFDKASALPQVGAITRIERVEDWSWASARHPADDILQLMAVDPATITHFVPLRFVQGDIGDVGGRNVAVVSGTANVGDSVRVQSADGSTVRLKVVASIESTSFTYGTFLIDESTLGTRDTRGTETWLAAPSPHVADAQLLSELRHTTRHASVLSRTAWVQQATEHTVASQRASILTIIGGAALLALFSLAESTLTSVRERSPELALLRRIGALPRSAVAMIIIESLIVFATAVILGAAVVGTVFLRMSTALASVSPRLSPVIPVAVLLLVLIACLITAAGSAMAGALIAIRPRRYAQH